jgi:hypothetical protein
MFYMFSAMLFEERLPADPVTDDRYYSVPSAELERRSAHVHVGTDLCHLTDRRIASTP